MDMLWMWPWITVAAVAVVVFFLHREISQSTRGDVAQRLACPSTGAEVTATFVSDFLEPSRYADVRRCSRFPGDGPPTCDKACLSLGKDAIVAQDLRRRPLPIMPIA